MTASGRVTRQFLLAAKRSEIANLKQLAVSCRLVNAISTLIHELQRERGMSNIWLGSGGERFGEQRAEQAGRAYTAELNLRDVLDSLGTAPLPGVDSTRLFASIAAALHGLDELRLRRADIERRALDADDVTQCFSQLIAGLLKVVFEAADIACDPDITRALVAMFNFMQGKEFAGQERAVAAACLAAGRFERSDQERLAHLATAQDRCFEIFGEYADERWKRMWLQALEQEGTREFLQLRALMRRLQSDDDVPPALSEIWYALATRRIDDMKSIEDELAASLLALGAHVLHRAEEDLRGHHERLTSPPELPVVPDAVNALGTPAMRYEDEPDAVSRRMLYQLIHDQHEHLGRMSIELDEARRALDDRKWIDRAKGLLMTHHGMSEEQAYRRLRLAAMSANRRLAEIAEDVVRQRSE